jgi:hypothetical protein
MSFIIGNRDLFWPDLKVPFEIPEKTFPKGSDSRKAILDAIKHINDKTEAQLFDRKGRSDISDYIEYRLSDTLDPEGNALACHSPVGRQGGRQIINCDGLAMRAVVHETCHSLGLRHEQQRPDRDDFVKVDLSKIPEGISESNYEIRNDWMFGAYDTSSIMHYRGSEITPKKSSVKLGGSQLSEGDIRAINAMKNAGFLTMEDDNSSARTIMVQSVDGTVSVKKGEFKKIVVPSNRFFWYSGDSREWTTASPSTNVVHVYRKREGREILWFCFNDPKEIRANLRFLGDEHDKCGSPTLKVFGQKTITVAKGGTARVDVGDREFEWRCGDSNEESTAPEGTQVIFVTRASSGRDITWACYKRE